MRVVGRITGPLLVAACLGALAGILVVSTRGAEVVAPQVVAEPLASPTLVAGDWSVPEPPEHPLAFTVADATGSSVELWDAPGQPRGETLDNPTWEGLSVVFLVLERADGWLHVRVSQRPNQATAWVRASEVRLRQVPNWIQVEVGARRVTVLHGDTPLLSTTVAVGRDATPTPLGSYFVDGVVSLAPAHPAYGTGQVSVSAFSPTLTSFGGGVGQIALHGTFATGLLGQPTSNGCVRLDNTSIAAVMDLAPTGTPVEIVA